MWEVLTPELKGGQRGEAWLPGCNIYAINPAMGNNSSGLSSGLNP
jgi:hypothetical protein